MKKHFKVGEFAELCHASKDTLLHYARMNLLPPKFTGANGYRFYGLEQFWDYRLIALLKATNGTLEEIRTCVDEGNPQNFLDFIKGRISGLHEEQATINYKIRLLTEIVKISEETLNSPFDKIFMMDVHLRQFQCQPVDDGNFIVEDKYLNEYSTRLKNIYADNCPFSLPFGFIIPKCNATRHKYLASSFFYMNNENNKMSLTMRSGRYMVLFHYGNSASHKKSFENLVDYIECNNLRMASNIFAFDLMNYIICAKDDNYILKYMVQI